MDTLNEQKKCIEQLVKSNSKFLGNEDLLEDFCAEALRCSYNILNSSINLNSIEGYLRKVVNTSILNVLKNSGRIRRLSSGYAKVQEVPYSTELDKTNKQSESFSYDIDKKSLSCEEKVIQKNLLEKIVSFVCKLDKEEPNKCYFEIFKSRYKDELKQKDISKKLNISQAEVSRRLIFISQEIKKIIAS